MPPVPFDQLKAADLEVDRVYEGGLKGNIGDDPIAKLLPVGNAGGFRFSGSPTKRTVRLAGLFTSNVDPDWPDRLDLATGTFVYYGDNKAPGRRLHDTPRGGNLFLRDIYSLLASGPDGRSRVPPIFLFARASKGHDVRFRGLLVPGAPTVPIDEQLVAVWRTSGIQRFQNYRATFSVLNVDSVPREWVEELTAGGATSAAPRPWVKWIQTGVPEVLRAPRGRTFRSREEQLPTSSSDQRMLEAIHAHFEGHPHDFEACAAQIWMMLAPATEEIELTQPSRDGGRDAIGQYVIGPPDDRVRIDFALEAKCYAPHNSVGVRETSRLISRLRHRNFGVFVTTSYVNRQAYQEIRDDAHPVAIVSGADIVEVLKRRGMGTVQAVSQWLATEFPADAPTREPSRQVDLAFGYDLAEQAVNEPSGPP
jgi:hypothetical protein